MPSVSDFALARFTSMRLAFAICSDDELRKSDAMAAASSGEICRALAVKANRKRINVVRLRILSRCRSLPLVGCWLKMEKRRNLYLSPSYVLRLLALPFRVGRQRRSPRLYMQSMYPAILPVKYRAGYGVITYPRASTVAQSLTLNETLREFQNVKNQRG